jgi:hypothetical protein
MRVLKALLWLWVGVSCLVVAATGYSLQATVSGWTVVPVGTRERLLIAPPGIAITAVGLIRLLKRR